MTDDLFFSVIIPTYNRADFIRQTIDSVLNQVYKNFEIIIVDDGSTDNTSEVIQPILTDKITYYKIANSERGKARNFGMDKAQGDYITFLDSDDIYYQDYLSNAKESLITYKLPPFFHLAYESKSVKSGKSLHTYSVDNDDIYSLIRGNHLSCLGVFLKREITLQFRFNEDRNLSGSEDWELWLRLAAHFGLKTDKRISAALMAHEARSVVDYDESKLPERKILALDYAFEDKEVRKIFGRHRRAMEAYSFTYISLHFALSGINAKAIHYLRKALVTWPAALLKIRTLAILKYLLLNLIKAK